MEQIEIETLLPFFKAMADESRLKLVGLVAGGERSVGELARLLKLKEPTVSHHLSILKEQDLVRFRIDGNTHWYRLNPEAIKTVNRVAFGSDRPSRAAGRVERPTWEQKVIGNFIVGDRLIEIPVSRKKRSAILRWLARRFAPDVTYSEAEVNRILKKYHSDCATLRRELIGCRMLKRDKGTYWRLPETEWLSD
jgi:hypothetical protein